MMENRSGSKGSGSLSRVNRLLEVKDRETVLRHLSYKDEEKEHPATLFEGIYSPIRARLILTKVQDSTVNFLSRWLLTGRSCISRASRGENSRRTRSSLLFDSVKDLPDRRTWTIVKFVFHRWLTVANFIELLLIIMLIGFCAYQCYELLEDYYQYPTHISITKVLNENFRLDLPAVTLCDNNRLSKETLKKNYPMFNESHFLAMSLGTFYSLNNYSVWINSSEALNDTHNDDYFQDPTVSFGGLGPNINPKDIDWVEVSRVLSKGLVAGFYNTMPEYDLIDTVSCANIWGEHLPCHNVHRIQTIQQGRACVTLFHDSSLWDPKFAAVRELEEAMSKQKSTFSFGDYEPDSDEYGHELLSLNKSLDEGNSSTLDDGKLLFELGAMEILRLRLKFRADDYSNLKAMVGGLISVHPNSVIGMMNHVAYNIYPGHRYNFYVERFDYKRLPAPYDTKCHDYESNRYIWSEVMEWKRQNRAKIAELIRRQVNKPGKLIGEYADTLRRRALGQRECLYICTSELSTSKCHCFPRNLPYQRDESLDLHGKLAWCVPESLLKRMRPNATNDQLAGDDLYYQLCIKDFFLSCMEACPDECNRRKHKPQTCCTLDLACRRVPTAKQGALDSQGQSSG